MEDVVLFDGDIEVLVGREGGMFEVCWGWVFLLWVLSYGCNVSCVNL